MSPSCVTQDRAESENKERIQGRPLGRVQDTAPRHPRLPADTETRQQMFVSFTQARAGQQGSLFIKEVRWGLGALIIQGEAWVPQRIQRKERRAEWGRKSNICNPKHFLKNLY